MIWALAALLLATTAAVLGWQDPRRLRVGVLGALALLVVVVGTFGTAGGAWVGGAAAVLLGVFSVANGVTMRRRRRGRSDAVSLVFGVAVLVWGVATVWLRVDWLLVAGVPLAFLGLVLVAFVGYGALYGIASARWARPVDVVIVLGAGLIGERVTPMLAARLDRGRQALDRSRSRGRDAHLICSGGQGPDEVVPEAVAMANHLAEAGVDRDLLWLEDASTSTEANLRLSADLAHENGVRQGRFAVVTNDFHAFRAAVLMRRIGLDGYSLGARTAPHLWPSAVLREYAAILWEHRVLNGVLLAVCCLPLLASAFG